MRMAQRQGRWRGPSHLLLDKLSRTSLCRCHAAVGQQQRSRHIARLIRRKKGEDVGHLFRSAAPPQRHHPVDHFLHLQAQRPAGSPRPRRVDRAGADAIGAHTVFCLLQRHALGEGVQKGFAGSVRREICRTVDSCLRAGKQNVASCLPQVRQRKFRHQKRGADVVANGPLEIFDAVGVGLRIGDKNPGVVHQNVYPPEPAHCGVDARACLPFLCQIPEMDFCFAPAGYDQLCYLLYRIGWQPGQHQPCALPRKFVGNRLADACPCARDDRDFVRKPHRFSRTCSCCR